MDFTSEWNDFKKRRRNFYLYTLSWVIIVLAIENFIDVKAGMEGTAKLAFTFGIPPVYWFGYKLVSWKCPSCKRQYSRFSWLRGGAKCSNCGLLKWTGCRK